jgi:uncharacterized protein YbbC (DUF1343 family)/thiamine biosynthesis lipoprotein ApbE/CubicO group peptidase (beta-lactamase class C family)
MDGPNSKPDTAGEQTRFEFHESHMGCTFKIVLYSTDAATASRASRLAYERVTSLDATLSDYQAESELSQLAAKAGGPPVAVGADLFDVLRKSKEFHAKTDGVLDVTIAPVGRLWRRARRDRKLPDPIKLAEARRLVGADNLILDPERRTVRLRKPGMRLDVGGIAKGYAAQAALDVLRKEGVHRALVAAAGDIVVGDPPPDAPGWTIAIAGLNPSKDEPIRYVSLSNRAISTSGDAERFVTIDGHRYSHIINPITGMGVEDRASVTVIAPDGTTADALETSVYLLGPERGLEIIDGMAGTAAIYVRDTPEGPRIFESARFGAIPLATPKQAGDGALPRETRRTGGFLLREVEPAAVGLDADRLRRIDEAVGRAVASGDVPGAVVMVGRKGAIAHFRAYGDRTIEPDRAAMTRDTLFDMASLTKPVVTATAIMLLVEEGKLRLTDHIVRYLPEFDNHGKRAITVEQLLRHRAGLVPDNPLDDYKQGTERAWDRIADLEPVAPPGERFLYSDVGFLILGRLVERISGMPLDRFAAERIFPIVGMTDAHFRPIGGTNDDSLAPLSRIAPTERETPGGKMLHGVVHDPRSRALGGVAGHAGLFAAATDLASFAQTLLNGGLAPNGRRLLGPLTVRAMIDAATTPEHQRRGLGWDIDTSYSGPRGSLFGPESFGHTGFTGTSLWIDPETQTFVILLTSRLHPTGRKPAPTALRSELATIVASSIADADISPRGGGTPVASPSHEPAASDSQVLCGVDVLIKEDFKLLRGQRVGLVTNQTGRARDGRSTIDVLFKAPDVKLVRLFSPEHGIRGDVDAKVDDGKDEATGLPIVSLYGERRKPVAADLDDLDTLVYDIQDIGVRYYTYESTLGLVLEAAKELGKRLVVLDRPNPLGGLEVEGPVRDPGFASFIAYHALPVRHGMTVGELARLYNVERGLGAGLEVVPCRGWSRRALFDRTGLLWINPSPNMRSLTEALLYPGVGWLEATNLATGRGTDTPFERVGAPWIEPSRLAQALNALKLPGVRFVPIQFIPRERQYKGERCGGVQILVTDWSRFEPVRLGLALAVTLRRLHRNSWKPDGILRMLCDQKAYDAILQGREIDEVEALWEGELNRFRQTRRRYLMYPEAPGS